MKVIQNVTRSFTAGEPRGPQAANFTHLQLLNPSSSERKIIITRWRTSVGAASVVQLRSFATPLTTLLTSVTNNIIGGPSPSAEFRFQNNASALGTALITEVPKAMELDVELVDEDPFILTPGNGLLVTTSPNNIQVGVLINWREE